MTNEECLRSACYDLARTTMQTRQPVDVEEISEVAAKYYQISLEHHDYLRRANRPTDFVVRAVRYLHDVHAIPPMRDDIRWFDNMLSLLVELVSPNTQLSEKNALFYRDIIVSLTESLTQLSQEPRDLP